MKSEQEIKQEAELASLKRIKRIRRRLVRDVKRLDGDQARLIKNAQEKNNMANGVQAEAYNTIQRIQSESEVTVEKLLSEGQELRRQASVSQTKENALLARIAQLDELIDGVETEDDSDEEVDVDGDAQG